MPWYKVELFIKNGIYKKHDGTFLCESLDEIKKDLLCEAVRPVVEGRYIEISNDDTGTLLGTLDCTQHRWEIRLHNLILELTLNNL